MDISFEYYDVGRLQAFNDAVFAIVATILILPLRNVEVSNGEDFVEYLTGSQKLVVVYLIAFLLVCSVWESHILRWIVVSHVDDVLVWLNMISLLFVSFLPFVVRLVSQYSEKKLPVVLTCVILVVLEVVEILIICYTFFQKILLRGELRILLPFELQQKRNYVLKRKLLNPILYIAAGGLSYVNLKISWVLIVLVIITPCVNRLFEVVIYRLRLVAETSRVFLHESIIGKERIECFSDGVYAIVATLLVLDISSEEFPTQSDVKQNGMSETMSNMWPKYMTYCGTFVVCTLLWFVQHSLFSAIKKVSYLMFIVNNVSLACIGSLPFLVKILNNYAESIDNIDKHAIQFGCLIVGVAGLSHFVVFTLALWNSEQYMCHRVVPVGAGSSNHNYLLIKLAVIPTVAIIIYACSFSSNHVVFVTYHTFIFVTPLIFIAVKFFYLKVFSNHILIVNVIENEQPGWTNQNNPGTFSPYDQYANN